MSAPPIDAGIDAGTKAPTPDAAAAAASPIAPAASPDGSTATVASAASATLLVVEDAPFSTTISVADLDALERRHHRFWFLAALFVILASFAFSNEGSEDVRIPLGAGSSWTLPRLCVARQLTGHACPGCGMTRSMVALAHGHPLDAWRYHRMGIAIFAVLVYQLVYRPIALARRPGWSPGGALGRAHSLAPHFVLAGLIVNWVVNLIIG